MTESGIVIKTEGDYATVKIDKKEECSKCGMCLFPKNASFIEIKAKNEVMAKEGDKVNVETRESLKLTSIMLAFTVPLIIIVLAVFLGLKVFKSELIILAVSIVLIGIWFCILSFIDKKLKKNKSTYSVITSFVEQ